MKLRKQPTRKRTNSTAQAVPATKCPAGSPTNRSAWPKSARPERRLRRRPQLPRRRKPKPNAQRRRNARRGTASARGRFLARPQKSPIPRRSAITDPDSRVLLTKDGFIQGYNAQAAVDGGKQIIVAHGLTQSMSDCPQLVVDAVRANLGRKPKEVSADAGYCSEDNLLALATRKIHAYVATGRAKHPAETTRKVGGEMTQKMRQKLKRAGYRSRYRLRKQIVEPVFGQIKQARGFRQFLLRGLEAVQAEWALICTAHNITKLAKAI